MKTIPKNLIDKRYVCVNYVVFLNARGEKEFIYLAVRGHRMPEFENALKKGGFYPEDYGFILEHGKGEADELIKQKMWLQYRCDHETAYHLLQSQQAHQRQKHIKEQQRER